MGKVNHKFIETLVQNRIPFSVAEFRTKINLHFQDLFPYPDTMAKTHITGSIFMYKTVCLHRSLDLNPDTIPSLDPDSKNVCT